MTFSKRQNYGDSKNHGCQGLRHGVGIKRQNIEDFKDSKNTLCDTVMMDTCHYTFVQTHGIYNTKKEP